MMRMLRAMMRMLRAMIRLQPRSTSDLRSCRPLGPLIRRLVTGELNSPAPILYGHCRVAPLGLDTDTVESTVRTLSTLIKPSRHWRVQFSHQFFTDVT
eukprot:3927422-Pyramimonas_sp.AAC.1